MIAVYRKELRSGRASMLGFVFMAFLLAAIGLYFSFTNLNLASPKFEAVFSSVQFVFLVFVPILTMRTLAEEKRQRTDQLLLTAPLKAWEIVVGKYLALLTVYAVPMAEISLYPLILAKYGSVNFRTAYGSVLGFFLLGCAYLGIGLFCSSLTGSPAISAVLTFLVLLLTYVMNTIARMVPASASGSLAAFLILVLLISLLVYYGTKHFVPAVLCFAAGSAFLFAIYQWRRPMLEGSFSSFLSLFYFNGRLTGFTEGVLDLRAVLYYLSIVCFMLHLTTVVVSRHDQRQDRRLYDGLYHLLTLLMTLAALVLINRIGSRLPSEWMERDFTTSGVYTLTQETREFLEGLDQEVRLIYLCERGKEDTTVERFLERYAQETPFMHYEKVDPLVYPKFASGLTDQKVTGNSILVVCDTRCEVISDQDMFTVGTSAVTGRRIETGFCGEVLLSKTVESLTRNRSLKFYLPDANGEPKPGESFLETAEKNGIEISSLNLLVKDEVPEDADGLILNAPSVDYSQETADKILRYLENGGKALILSGFSLEPMPQFERILADYGMVRLEGIILEGVSDRFMSYPYCVIPSVSYTGITSEVYRDRYLLMPMAQAIRERETYRDSIRLTPLLSTSTESYNKADVQNMTTSEMEPEDEAGPFLIGMLAEEDIDRDGVQDTEVVLYSSGYFLDEDYNRSVSGSNALLFGSTLQYLAGEDTSRLQIPEKSLQDPVLSMTDFAANFWTVICVFVLPGLHLLAGVILWAVRRYRR